MEKLIIQGGQKLEGELKVAKAKNCVLALLAASILTDEKVILRECPRIADVYSMINILVSLGVQVRWQGNALIIDSNSMRECEIPAEYAKEVRSSIFLMGSILGKFRKAKAVFPGGCDIGLRPIDLHLKGLRALDVTVEELGGYLYCDGTNARGGVIYLDFPSVGATENIMLAAATAKGITLISNAAKEPEIVALQDFLNAMGAKITGGGRSEIIIEGVSKLHGVEFTPIPDRIVAGTYLLAAAATGGTINVTNCEPSHMNALLSKINGVYGELSIGKDNVCIKAYERLKCIKMIETQPYPGFPTDLQAQILALQTIAEGAGMVVENMFETRFKHVAELTKMGADVIVRDRTALIRGVDYLQGAEVAACDLRGGAALVLAGLAARGTTVVSDVRHIDRGYYLLERELTSVGAYITRV